jgi:nitronate monooxygenase
VEAPLCSWDSPRLTAEVSRAGGLGSLSLFGNDSVSRKRLLAPASARRLIDRVRARTHQPFLVALMQPFEPESILDACFAAGARLFQVFWWNGPRLAPRIRSAGGKVFWQVGSREQALDAARCGADVLVAQGTEAAGPVRGGAPLRELIPLAADATDLPVVGCGGLADRADVIGVLALGARAAMLGTRFAASLEARAAPACKARLVRATAGDLYLDHYRDGDWPEAPRRRIRTAFNRGGCALYAGRGVGRIHDIPPAAEIVCALDPGPHPAADGQAAKRQAPAPEI